MNGIKTGLGITPGEHIISADSALSRNIRHCFCLSCHGRLFLSPLPIVLEWHCVMCDKFFPGKKFCEACGTGIYCRAVCTKSVYSYRSDLLLDP
ncbi:putative zinc ribbon protein [Escherichia coli]|uniref:putative zinc ribbon protein n=1 Tax=Escherichia coli TaxID=562 RepID=UPI000F4ACC29|nr:putative zinc ribbon protein [Escherichia coli]